MLLIIITIVICHGDPTDHVYILVSTLHAAVGVVVKEVQCRNWVKFPSSNHM